MGGDSWTVLPWFSHGIIVRNKDILDTWFKEEGARKIEATDLDPNSPLSQEVVAWLLDQASPQFHCYDIAHTLTLLSVSEEPTLLPTFNLSGPYEIQDAPMAIDVKPAGDHCKDLDVALFEMARKLTPLTRKLPFRPGLCFITSCYHTRLLTKHILKGSREEEVLEKKQKATEPTRNVPDTIPKDLDIIVGEGATKKTFSVNTAIVCCYVEGIDQLLVVDDKPTLTKLELPTLNPQAFEAVLVEMTSRRKDLDHFPYGEFPDQWGGNAGRFRRFSAEEQPAINAVLSFLKTTSEPETKKQAVESTSHPALSDPRWLDAVFLVGPTQTEIKVNRAALSSMNPVLCKMLYGTGLLQTDPHKPIVWPDFDPAAVRLVFEALLAKQVEELTVPVELADEKTRSFMDYIGESDESLNVYFDTPFERDNLDGAYFDVDWTYTQGEKDRYGLKKRAMDYHYDSQEPFDYLDGM